MFKGLFYRILGDDINRKFKQVYDAGICKGYELGYMMGKVERTNRGFIIGSKASKVDQEIEQILKEKGG